MKKREKKLEKLRKPRAGFLGKPAKNRKKLKNQDRKKSEKIG